MYFIAFLQKKFGKEGTILSGDACDKSYFHVIMYASMLFMEKGISELSFVIYLFLNMRSMITAKAPSPVTLHAVPKLSMAM